MVSLYVANEEGSYIEADTIPSSGYTLNTEQSYCGQSNNGEIIKDDTVILAYENGSMRFSNVTKKGTKCYLYFDVDNTMTVQELIASKNIDSSRSGAITGTLTTDTTGTVYSVADDWGTSYVYAGTPTDNWVYFAGFYWRIIRINGDGSIRMIYAGTDPEVTTGEGTQIGTSAYNSEHDDNAYVGYMYGSTGASSYSATHTNTNDSTIKTVLDEWYQNNLASYSSYISTEAGFCNDRQTQSMAFFAQSYGTLGYGTNNTGYAPLGRLYENNAWKTSPIPSLRCTNTNDLFTVRGSSKGNRSLDYPIGLITSDEVVLAGGFMGASNSSYYLYTNQIYWTMSPYYYSGLHAYLFYVSSSGTFSPDGVNYARGVRPVINLSPDVTLSGTGTTSNPYLVS